MISRFVPEPWTVGVASGRAAEGDGGAGLNGEGQNVSSGHASMLDHRQGETWTGRRMSKLRDGDENRCRRPLHDT